MIDAYIGGWDCESNREIVFVSFVRACVRAGGRGEAKLCGRVRRCFFSGWGAGGRVVLRCGVAWRGGVEAWRCLGLGRVLNLVACEYCLMNRCAWMMGVDN